MRAKAYLLLLGVLLTGLGRLVADEVSSEVFGYCSLTMLGNSDTFVSVPFARPEAALGVVASVSGGNVVQLQNSPGWTPGQYVYSSGVQSNTYYLRFTSGALEGRFYTVTSNTTDSLILSLNGDSLSNVVVGDAVSVVPYWTMGTVFVNGNGIHASSSTLQHKTEVLIPALTNSGINLSVASTYYYLTNSSGAFWRKVNSAVTNLNDDILQPNAYMIVRHLIATNTTFVAFGNVVLTKVSIPLLTNPSSKQDNFIGLLRPINVALSNSTLFESGAFAASTSFLAPKDELLAFDNTTTNINKSVSATYFYFNSGWRQSGMNATNDFGGVNLTPGNGYIIRKAATTTNVPWLNTPTY